MVSLHPLHFLFLLVGLQLAEGINVKRPDAVATAALRGLEAPIVATVKRSVNDERQGVLQKCLNSNMQPIIGSEAHASCAVEVMSAFQDANSTSLRTDPGQFCTSLCEDQGNGHDSKCIHKCMNWVNPMDFCESICPDDHRKSMCVTDCEVEMYRCRELPRTGTDNAQLECVQKTADKYKDGVEFAR